MGILHLLKRKYFERRNREKLLRPYKEVMPDKIIIPTLIFLEVFEGEEGTTNFRNEAVRPVKELLKNGKFKKK
jgi:hypothetical protein